jgi:hypothetical protein
MNAPCRDIRPLLSNYMDNELTAADVRVVQAHVAGCQECASVLAEYRELRSLVRALPQPVPPVALRGSVFAKATPTYRRRALLWDFSQRGLTYGAMAVALVALLFTASLLVRGAGNSGVLGALDRTAPVIVDRTPYPETDNWGLNQPVQIVFSEPMDEGSVLAALQIVTEPALSSDERARIAATARWEGNTLVLGGLDLFRADTIYTIEFDPLIARDRAGNPLRAQNQAAYRFRTIDTVAFAASVTPVPGVPPTVAPTRTISIVTEVTPSATLPPLPALNATATPTPTTRSNAVAALTSTATRPAAAPTNTPVVAPPVPQQPETNNAPPVAPTATLTVPPPTATVPPAQPTPTTPPPAPTVAPTATPTVPPTIAPTATPPPPTATPAPPTPTATPKLPYPVVGGFGQLYERNGDVRDRVGLPNGSEARVVGAYQIFEHGLMIWREDTKTIYVLFNDQSTWYSFADAWAEGMDAGGGAGPAAGQFAPKRGFGKVWREQPDVQKRLGYALSTDEIATDLVVQPFERGLFLWSNATGKPMIYALYQNNLYERYDDPSGGAARITIGG